MTSRRRARSFAAPVVLALWWASLAVPVTAQEPPRGWTFIVAGGYATTLNEDGSFSFGASALRPRSSTLSLGLEGGYDRHEVSGGEGETWWNGSNLTGECPSPCTWQRVRFTDHRVRAAWHAGAVLRYIFAPARTVVPSAELGLGLYGFRYHSSRQTRDATSGARVPELSSDGSSTQVAPGLSAALGLDLFPGNGRIGIGAVGRLRGAAVPSGDGLFAAGFASLQARITVR
jgi:hypothetical protein